jgi:hypothetical protein
VECGRGNRAPGSSRRTARLPLRSRWSRTVNDKLLNEQAKAPLLLLGLLRAGQTAYAAEGPVGAGGSPSDSSGCTGPKAVPCAKSQPMAVSHCNAACESTRLAAQ